MEVKKISLQRLGSIQRGSEEPITPLNHPVILDSDVKRAPLKHRMEELQDGSLNATPMASQNAISSAIRAPLGFSVNDNKQELSAEVIQNNFESQMERAAQENGGFDQ